MATTEGFPSSSSNSQRDINEALWEQAVDDGASTGDYGPAQVIELTRKLDLLSPQIAAVTAAQEHLKATVDFLVKEAYDDGRPDRDILSHKDYLTARERLLAAEQALQEASARV